ncbi:dihydroorotase [Magnetospira sp. QH-2]|uniref:dihydroorotase n=1 Tax=Magnetospira sp. (strain QH-2) TaxID=1288970 RepID=UPI0003E81220|nr:dihydroorotase [Magnetospira sp. QH-2]CCQ72583.1 Dihydroorotase (DHOase) [Magnetospira sp. QH-2]
MAVTDIPPPPTAYVNARLMDPATGLDQPGTLYAEGETIADLGPGLFADGVPSHAQTVDCEGLILSPGLVDMRVQLREPGEEHKGTLASAGLAAAAGGVTSMVCLPNTRPVIDDVSVVEFVARRARLLGLAKVYPYGAVTKGLEGQELAEMGMLAESGAVAFTDGTVPVADTATMRRALQYAATFDLLIVQHPEEPGLAGSGVVNAGTMATRLGLVGIPPQAEVMMIERDLRLLELTGGRLHFAHVTTGEAIDVIRRAKVRGLQVTCDTAPFYFALNELAVGDYRTFSKLSPPLRTEDDRLAVIEGLRDGTIDVIASDHAPEDEEAKRLPFGQAAYGGIGLETLLPITLELVRNGHLELIEALRLITSAPADLLGLTGGRLTKGAPADLLLFDPEKPWKIDRDDMISKSKNTPFDGYLTQGRPKRTVVDGRTVFQF